MNPRHPPDWDPRAPSVQADQISAYDAMRRRCPVAHSEYLHWSLFRHADVVQALHDHATFSNQVSERVSVPNGMDPPEHTAYRRMIEPYFGPQALARFEPEYRRIARDAVASLPRSGEVEWMAGFAGDVVVRMLRAFMGWPQDLQEPLREWTRKNHAATLSGDRAAMAAVAFEFDGHIRAQLWARRESGSRAAEDVTARLMAETVNAQPLTGDRQHRAQLDRR
jgi:cytochrome P450